MDIRLMTYNICSGLSYGKDRRRDLAQAAEVIKQYSPDILSLNEVHYNIGFSGFAKQAEELTRFWIINTCITVKQAQSRKVSRGMPCFPDIL
jgi:endonuclease/exonuclease/phosphatase family metal-dependent hydrolase